MSTRPARLVLVAGTATEIGKTFVAAALARHLAGTGVAVAARKPAQSFDPAVAEPTDAEVLGLATAAAPDEVCPPQHWYPTPMAPPMAAASLGRPVPTLADLLTPLRWPEGTAVGLLETAGGVASPQAADGDVADLLRRVEPDQVLLVADAGLGTINAVRLAVAHLAGGAPVHVHLNRFDEGDELHQRNRAWLRERDALDVSCSIEELAARVPRHA